MNIILYISLVLHYPFELPSVSQRSTSEALFGICPDSTVDAAWNPVFVCQSEWEIDFLNEERRLPTYRMALPIFERGGLHLGTRLSFGFEEEDYVLQSSFDSDKKVELLIAQDLFTDLTAGVSVFLHRVDSRRASSTLSSIDECTYRGGVKMGVNSCGRKYLSGGVYKDDTSSEPVPFAHGRYQSRDCGIAAFARFQQSLFGFVGAYHRSAVNRVELIKAVRLQRDGINEFVCFLPLVLKLPVSSFLILQGGYTAEIVDSEDEVAVEASTAVGFSYHLPSLAITVNLTQDLTRTYYWEVGISYGH